jgi:Zinc carboxypeptidase
MSTRVKLWAAVAGLIIVFAFAGWQAATLIRQRHAHQSVLEHKSRVEAPKASSAGTAGKRQPKAIRSLNEPERIQIPVANTADPFLPSALPSSRTTSTSERATPSPTGIAVARIDDNPFFSDFVDSSTVFTGESIRVITGLKGSPSIRATKSSETDWVIELDKTSDFFLLRVEGAAGRTVTFEIRNVSGKWSTLNPVYSYVTSLDELQAFDSQPANSPRLHQAPNGAKLPDTRGQSWQFIEDVKYFNNSFWFRQKFDKDAYVATRYPYTLEYNQRYLSSLTNNSAVKVIPIPVSAERPPLEVVKIGDGTEADEQRKPCVLIYAREHGSEQDGSWVAQGAVDFLISQAPEARQIREQLTFLVIPRLRGKGVADSFMAGMETPESIAYSGFFKSWVDRGNPLQLVLNLHNLVSHEGPHLQMLIVEPDKTRLMYSRAFCDSFVRPAMEAERFLVAKPQVPSGIPAGRLGAWLSSAYGTLHVGFELNTQEQSRHLTLAELREMGKLLVEASSQYLSSGKADSLVASINEIRRAREARWEKYGGTIVGRSAIETERNCQWREQSDRLYAEWGGRPPK